MSVKTYILLDHTKSTAQVYLQVNANQRVRLENRPIDHAYGQITFTDRDGGNKTIRYVSETDEIFQDKQIKELMIPANRKYLQSERDDLMFRDGVLLTDNPTVQKFLETSPQFEDFWLKEKDPEGKERVGRCPNLRGPLYKLYDENVELDTEDEMFMLRLEAAKKIAALKDLAEAQALMIRLNGAFFKAPDDIRKCRSELIRFLDEADKPMLDNLLKDDINLDEKTTVLIGKAINLGILSFDRVEDQVVKIKGNKVTNLKEISTEYGHDERKRYFAEFLTSRDGKLLMEDLEKEVAAAEKKKKKELATA